MDAAPFTLGEDGDLVATQSAEELLPHLIALASQARRRVQIFSPELGSVLYGDADFVAALAHSARDSRHLRIEILLGNPQSTLARGHQLVLLAQQLSSSIEIRRTHKDFHNLGSDYLLADARAYVLRKNASRFDAETCYNDPLTVDGLGKQFSQVWEASTREREFLRLHI